MPPSRPNPLTEPFRSAADAVAAARSDVDVEMAREVLAEAATLLHDGLVLDHLDDHDACEVVAALCADLVSEDPGAAVRARSRAALDAPGGLHEPAVVSSTYLVAASVLQL